MEFPCLFLRCHFAGKPAVVSRNVGCFFGLHLPPSGVSHAGSPVPQGTQSMGGRETLHLILQTLFDIPST